MWQFTRGYMKSPGSTMSWPWHNYISQSITRVGPIESWWGIRATDSLEKFVTAMQRALDAFPLGQRDEPRTGRISPWHNGTTIVPWSPRCANSVMWGELGHWLDQLGWRIIHRLYMTIYDYIWVYMTIYDYILAPVFSHFFVKDAFSQQQS